MRAYLIDATDISEELYAEVEPLIVGELTDHGYVWFNGTEWTPRKCRIEDAHWDDGHCTWGAKCSACGARFEHETASSMNFCKCCGASNEL
jgi:hypothetical protein